jgi:large subunit ribosomal protein L25
MKGHKIEVNKRELSSKKSFVRHLRTQDEIPGIYYSHDSKDSIPFSVSKKTMHEALKSDAQVYQISVGSKDRDVIIKSVQYHPISEEMLHIDLYGVKMDQEVTVKIPIEITGQSEGIKAGGVLNQVLTEIEISCLPGNIPQNVPIDITNLDIGDSIRLAQLSMTDDVTLVGDEELLIVSIIQPTKAEEVVEEDTEIDGDITEGIDSESDNTESSEETNDENAE